MILKIIFYPNLPHKGRKFKQYIHNLCFWYSEIIESAFQTVIKDQNTQP